MPDDDDSMTPPARRRPGAPAFATPASGVRAGTAGTAGDHVIGSARRSREDATPVESPAIMHINERTKAISTSTIDMLGRVSKVEAALGDQRVELAGVNTKVVALDSKVDVLVTESLHTRREREEREKRAETRAETELAYRRDRTRLIIAIVVPTIVALTGLIAGLAGAFR